MTYNQPPVDANTWYRATAWINEDSNEWAPLRLTVALKQTRTMAGEEGRGPVWVQIPLRWAGKNPKGVETVGRILGEGFTVAAGTGSKAKINGTWEWDSPHGDLADAIRAANGTTVEFKVGEWQEYKTGKFRPGRVEFRAVTATTPPTRQDFESPPAALADDDDDELPF